VKNSGSKIGSNDLVHEQKDHNFGVFSASFDILKILFSFFATIFKFSAVILGALFGNYIGDKLRTQVTNQAGHQLEFIQRDEYGNTFIAANLLLSNFFPALFAALLARPRWLFAFLGGMAASFILADHYEDWMWEKMDELLSGQDPTRDWPDPIVTKKIERTLK
jgi:hypothetical protein